MLRIFCLLVVLLALLHTAGPALMIFGALFFGLCYRWCSRARAATTRAHRMMDQH